MTKRLKHNLTSLLVYSVIAYVILLPFQMYVTGISLALLIGFTWGMLNDAIIQLRKLNGEEFPNLEDDSEKKRMTDG